MLNLVVHIVTTGIHKVKAREKRSMSEGKYL
jgi:hypothetical protein